MQLPSQNRTILKNQFAGLQACATKDLGPNRALEGHMKRWMIAAVAVLLAGAEAGARAKLINIWAAPGVQNLTFANQKVIGAGHQRRRVAAYERRGSTGK